MILCPQCSSIPDSHSFSIYHDSKNHSWFYSSDHYRDRNTTNIINHIRLELDRFHIINPGKKWSWLIDSYEFSIRWNTLEMIKEMIGIIFTYKDSFGIIKIIRPNKFIKATMELIKPFMSDWMTSKIKIDEA